MLKSLVKVLLVLCLLIGWRGNPVLHSVVLAVVVAILLLQLT